MKTHKTFKKKIFTEERNQNQWAFKQNCGVNRSFHSHTLQQDELSVPVMSLRQASAFLSSRDCD